MSTSAQLRTILPDIAPSIAVAQPARAEADASARVFGSPTTSTQKVSFCMAVLLVATAIASVLLLDSPQQATATLERLALRLQAAQRIPPETRNVVGELLALRLYDCDQVRCDEQLRMRNHLARERLKEIIFGTSVAISLDE